MQELYPAVYRMPLSASPCSPSLSGAVPIECQRFLSLYILHHIAKPTRPTVSSSDPMDTLSQSISHPRTEIDQLVASLLHAYDLQEQQQKRRSALSSETSDPSEHIQEQSGLGPDLMFALAYWKSLRDGNWIRRERLLHPESSQHPLSWEQHLMIRHSKGDALGTARTLTVVAMCKAYYSLPVSVIAQAVGLVKPKDQKPRVEGIGACWVEKLQSLYGLPPTIIVRDEQLMFKAKKS
ncbi:hypothetical protein BGX28_002695 [Mortierella sp. GBA30]|nr:hypothetical protein BGX28_002695 [Mortierella sp. GBA30]